MLYAAAAALIVVLDQLLKHWVVENIPLRESVGFIPGIMALTHVRNTGAAFSMLAGMRWLLILVSAAFAVVIVVVLCRKTVTHPLGAWSLVMVLGGAVGNLIDRVRLGYVVDMFEALFVDFAIFNLADCFVVVGGILACVYFGFIHDKLKKPGAQEDGGDEA